MTKQPWSSIKIVVFRNGDPFYSHRIVVNPRQTRTMDILLNDITDRIQPVWGCIRRLMTPVNGHSVNLLSDLQNGRCYVAGRGPKLIRISYNTEPILQTSIPLPRVKPSRVQVPRKYKDVKSRLKEDNFPLLIYVHQNGNNIRGPSKVILRGSSLKLFDLCLDVINDEVKMRSGAVRRLYTVGGEVVETVGQLLWGEHYVAVGSEKKFIFCHYRTAKGQINFSSFIDKK